MKLADDSREDRLNPDSFAHGYFKNAVYRHWDPSEDIPQTLLKEDRTNLLTTDDLDEQQFDLLRSQIALFGAGEEAVTEDLAPLALVLDDIDAQMFVASQIYEEAKHTQFFDRYWREVIRPVTEERGYEPTSPTDERYFSDQYIELFDRTETAMKRLVTDDTPENRAKAFCHYHLVIESVLAQTAYYGFTARYSEGRSEIHNTTDAMPHLPGLLEGISYIRADEGRHVGFGMHSVRALIHEDGVDDAVVRETIQSLLPLVTDSLQANRDSRADSAPLVEYARDKIAQRIEVLTDAEAEIPAVDELVDLTTTAEELAGE
ncbi:ribonucleoside-diphosphate reductase [Halogeometricum borinquense]|uniref:Ribonucleoside-diphosphate reductase n=1 Tax=Halogeometricum borinquense TaxID=60847 RepID=A0A482TDD2_9EURY|nr:ribonucleoside-diphosphate reductase [Halogeometricum borinquense]RYJ14316.1 ribonucleoside-diphosphate reductase [Halogeometricum borinquense]